jgi:hypothetical protein
MRFSKRNTFTKNKKIDLTIKYKQRIDLKPRGLWYSYYGSWYNWAVDEMPKMLFKYNHKIEIKKDSLISIRKKDINKILLLDNKKDIITFSKRYGIINFDNDYIFINWNLVSKDYGGVEFNPYLKNDYDIMDKYIWYRTIDVSSGCIWNLDSIISKTEIVYEKRKKEYVRI